MAAPKSAQLRRWLSHSRAATEALAFALGSRLTPGDLLALSGDLGTGKTCFVRGLARALGIEAGVASPTYALMAVHQGRLPLYHYDAWMEGREKAFLAEGGELWFQGDGVAVVEWADRVAAQLPEPYLALRLFHHSPSQRLIEAQSVGRGPRAVALQRLIDTLQPPPGVEILPAGLDLDEPRAPSSVEERVD